jgi:hypothetical protein
MSKTKVYFQKLEEILEHLAPRIKEADKLLRTLENRQAFNASGFTILSIPEYVTLVALLARCLVDNNNFGAPSGEFRNPKLIDADMVRALLFPDESGTEAELPHDEWGRPLDEKEIH